MSDEHFLTRWSRKKREAAEDARAPQQPEAAEVARAETTDAGAEGAPAEETPAVDLESLPPLESIGAGTDIRAFLQRGVPAELTRAALRRAWTSDPTIRDFIGIAENQWDFAAGDVPGFGPLKAVDEVRRMVAEIGGELGKATERAVESAEREAAAGGAVKPNDSKVAEASSDTAAPQPSTAAAEDQTEQKPEAETSPPSIVQSKNTHVAVQQETTEREYEPVPTRRSHGRALPE